MKKTRHKGHVLITGAAGFLGRYVVLEALESGFAVRATDLPGKDLEWAAKAGAEVVYGDLLARDQVRPMFKGVKLVAHLAAVHDLAWPRDRLLRVNKGCAVIMAEEAAAAGVKHFVYCSSADTYGTHSRFPVREDFSQRPENNYALSKLAAERAVVEIAESRGLPVTTLRPTIIYGPWCMYAAGMLCAVPIILHRRMGSLPRVEGGPLVNAVHVEDAAGAIVFALPRTEMAGQFYNVADDQWLTSGEFFRHVVDPLEVFWSSRKIKLSNIAMGLGTGLAGLVPSFGFGYATRVLQAEWSKIVREHDLVDALKPTFDKGFLSYGTGDHVYDNSRLKQAGYSLRRPRFDHGYRETVEWYKQRRWIPQSARDI